MALDTYTNLKASIADWLNRTDLTSVIPDFITIAETQIQRKLEESLREGLMLPRNMAANNPSFALTAATESESLPADFLGVLSFTIDAPTSNPTAVPQVQLDYIDPQNFAYLKQRRGQNAAQQVPGLYTIIGTSFYFLPIPLTTYTANLWYWQKFTALSGSNATNWILTNHPDVYLYGALCAAAPYLIDDARATVWAGLFTQGLDDLIKSDPLPPNRSWLRADQAMTFRQNNSNVWNINTGDFIYGP